MYRAPGNVGPYTVVKRLASGGMGEVFLVKDGQGAPRVLKRMASSLAGHPAAVDRFVREIEILRRIHHPGVVRYLDHGDDDGPYHVCEYVPGLTLAKMLDAANRELKPLSDLVVLRIVRAAADALYAVHRAKTDDGAPAGIVHLDVTPHNVIVTPDGLVKLIDFGISHASYLDNPRFTNRVAGTYAYAAPEQVREEAVDARADIWSLGVLLYEALTGEHPFPQGEPGALLAAVGAARFEPVKRRRADLAGPVAAIVERCMQAKPDDRFASADDLSAALSAAEKSVTPDPGAEPLSRWMRTRFGRALNALADETTRLFPEVKREVVYVEDTVGTIRTAAVTAVVLAVLAFGAWGLRAWYWRLPEAEAAGDAGHGRVFVFSVPEGARVRVNGEQRGTTPYEDTEAPFGRPIEVKVELDGHESAVQRFSLTPDDPMKGVVVELKRR